MFTPPSCPHPKNKSNILIKTTNQLLVLSPRPDAALELQDFFFHELIEDPICTSVCRKHFLLCLFIFFSECILSTALRQTVGSKGKRSLNVSLFRKDLWTIHRTRVCSNVSSVSLPPQDLSQHCDSYRCR